MMAMMVALVGGTIVYQTSNVIHHYHPDQHVAASLALFASFATIMMLGFGLLIGGWARNESQAAPLSNLIAFPMMFLSGIFFPRFLFPEWLQGVTSYIPLSPVIDGFRLIMTENANLFELGSHLLVIAIWTIAIYILAIKLFRWE
jgi:ABC-2 type transport system permease protein